jgi:NADH-quinone oxidoreductase subunit J
MKNKLPAIAPATRLTGELRADMTFEQLLFYFFGGMLVVAASMVITMRNPIHSALFLVVAFFNCAAIWLLLEAEFLAITLVLVYVGAVMVLFVFVIMMLDINIARLREGFARYLPIAAIVGVLIAIEMILVVGPKNFGLDKVAEPARHVAGYSNTKELGRVLYTEYVYSFEIASAILLIAIVAAIALTLRRRSGTRHQNIPRQIAVKRNDRLKIIKMDAEKPVSHSDEVVKGEAE